MAATRMGRPPKPQAEVERRGVAFRVTEPFHARLIAAAETEGRSLAEQVTWMLETMLRDQDQRAMMREVVAEALAERFGRKITPDDILAVMGDGAMHGVVRNLGPTIGGKPDA